MTSPDAFEALATAVLREADPSYVALIHVGTNAEGRTVRSPVDGIGLRVHRGSRRLLVIQHTITARQGLRRKWLAPKDGDVDKAKAIVAAERRRGAVREAILVLCCTSDPDEELFRDVHAAAGQGLKVDIWPGSRLADFLDRNPEGQWLRQRQFGTEAVRLSASQARSTARRSLDDYLPLVARADIVARGLDTALLAFARDGRCAGFVIGEPGLGKSAALRRLGDRWLADGGIALVLDHEMIEQSATVDQAIALGLRKWVPSLDAGCGQVALSFATPEHPLLLIVEDVNRSANPRRIVERLISWSGAKREGEAAAEWRLLCPVWRGNAGVSDSQLRDHILNRSLLVDRFEPSEAVEAVMTRVRAAGIALTRLQANELAAALGNDPLLIGLNTNWATTDPGDAIHSYVTTNVEDAADDKLLAGDLRSALELLAERMVEARSISPSWDEIRNWFAANTDGLAGVRRLVDQGRIVRLGTDDRLAYRHDRVRDRLLVGAIIRLINAERFTSDLWAEPFYAGLIGAALTMLPLERIDEAGTRNPVALFAALQDPSVSGERQARLLAAANQWTASPDFSGDASESLRSHALRYLSRTDGAFVPGLVRPFPHSFWKLEALARNGHASATAALCRTSDPGTSDPWRDRIIAHTLARHSAFVDDVAGLLQRPKLPANDLEGVLNLAGEIGDPRLCDALACRWSQAGGSAALSRGWLWAVLRCCPPVGHPLADEVCRAWAALPSKVSRKPDKSDDNPRWDIAGYSLPWGMGRKPDPATIAFLFSLPKRHRGLSDTVHTIISHIDAPEAVLWSVKASAAIDRRIEGKGSINLAGIDLERRWSPGQHGRALSPASRTVLETLWRNKRINRFDRRTAFRVWCLTPTATELAALPALEADPVLADQALRTRLTAGDRTAVPLLSDRLRTAVRGWVWWYQARKVGLCGLESDVRRFFDERRCNPPETVGSRGDHIVAELLMDSRSDFAIAILLEYWEQLRTSPSFVLAALYLATPETTRLAQAAVTASDNRCAMFDHVNLHWGINVTGRPGITELVHLQALEPFLTLIGEGQFGQMNLGYLFEAANRLRELAWRKRHLDPLLTVSRFGHCPADRDSLYASLDSEVQHAVQHNRNWFAVDHWFAKREKEGWDRGTLLGLIADWAADRGSGPAVRLLCEALIHFGTRRDLTLLDRIPTALRQAGSTPIAGCVYDVRRRSL